VGAGTTRHARDPPAVSKRMRDTGHFLEILTPNDLDLWPKNWRTGYSCSSGKHSLRFCFPHVFELGARAEQTGGQTGKTRNAAYMYYQCGISSSKISLTPRHWIWNWNDWCSLHV